MKIAIKSVGIILASFVLMPLISNANAETVKYAIKNDAIANSLTGKKGDPIAGRKVAINRRLGNCLACHKMPIPEQSFHGKTGPNLAGVASRYKEGELRLRVVNSKKVNPASFMPGYYRTEGLHRVEKKWRGKTILSAQQVEDVVAYLMTLREDTSFKKAFNWARKANLKLFEWRGKVYSTGLKTK